MKMKIQDTITDLKEKAHDSLMFYATQEPSERYDERTLSIQKNFYRGKFNALEELERTLIQKEVI